MKDLENNPCAKLSIILLVFLTATMGCVAALILVEQAGRIAGFWR